MNSDLNQLQQKIEKNERLVYYFIKLLGKTKQDKEYEELVAIGKEGLTKAAITFKETKGSFASYAITCIRNEIFMYFRNNKKHMNDISMNTPISIDKDGGEILLEEAIEDKSSNFVERVHDRYDVVQAISVLLNCLKEREKIIMLYRIGGISQKEIGAIKGISRSYVSKIEKKAIKEIKRFIYSKLPYKEMFYVKTKEDYYEIEFFYKDFGRICEEIESIQGFNIRYKEELVVIRIHVDNLEAFAIFADIIQRMQLYSADNETK